MTQEQLFFEQEIIRIKEEYGTQYFSKSGFYAVLKDLSPQIERKYFTVLKYADDFGLVGPLTNDVFWAFLFGKGVTDFQLVINDASNQSTIYRR
jgi:hypothetical protein